MWIRVCVAQGRGNGKRVRKWVMAGWKWVTVTLHSLGSGSAETRVGGGGGSDDREIWIFVCVGVVNQEQLLIKCTGYVCLIILWI